MLHRTSFVPICLVGLACRAPSPAPSAIEAVTGGARLSALPPEFTTLDRVSYGGLQDALRNGCLDYAERLGLELPAEMERLVDALRLVQGGRNEQALASFRELELRSEDSGVRGLASVVVSNLLYERGEYAAVRARMGDADDAGARLVRLLADLPAQSVVAAPRLSDELWLGPRGHPMVKVRANGEDARWFVDTGAAQSVVSASAAQALGVEVLDAQRVDIGTATTLVRPARVGRLEELRLGDVLARDVPVLVYGDQDLTFELASGEVVHIDGIVGWPLIRELRMELDYAGGTYGARVSTPAPPTDGNFSWLGYPMVRVASEAGQPLCFGLDTGSWNTSISDNVFRKVEFAAIRDDTVDIGGVGGTVSTEVRIVDRLGLVISDLLVELWDVRTEQESGADDVLFFAADGVLGSDIAQHGRLVLDYRNGLLDLSASSLARAPHGPEPSAP